jgi:hypothetical protein
VVDAVVTPAALTLGVSESRLLTVCNGDLSAAAVFNGKLNMEEVNRLLQRFEGGKRCRSSATLSFLFHLLSFSQYLSGFSQE